MKAGTHQRWPAGPVRCVVLRGGECNSEKNRQACPEVPSSHALPRDLHVYACTSTVVNSHTVQSSPT